MPTNKSTIASKPAHTKEELQKIKILRGFGVKQLMKHKQKIRKNIKVFQDAIKKERDELKRVDSMVKVLKDDIKQATKLKKLIK